MTVLEREMGAHYSELMATVFEKIRYFYHHQLGVDPVDGILDIDVSFDGTYPKRGFKSKHSLGFVVEVHTGFIIDFDMNTKCKPCSKQKLNACTHDDSLLVQGIWRRKDK